MQSKYIQCKKTAIKSAVHAALCSKIERKMEWMEVNPCPPTKSVNRMSLNSFHFLKKQVVTTVHFHRSPCCSLFTNPVCVLKWSFRVQECTLAQTGPFINSERCRNITFCLSVWGDGAAASDTTQKKQKSYSSSGSVKGVNCILLGVSGSSHVWKTCLYRPIYVGIGRKSATLEKF